MEFTNIKIDRNGNHIYIQLAEWIKDLIKDKKVEHNTKLPTIRKLSEQLNVNNVTIINAYKLLEKEGYITKKVGSGSYVNYKQLSIDENYLDFTGKDSNIDSFPLNDITDSILNVLKQDGVNAFKYEDSEGYKPLKESLTNYFKFYDIETKPELIQIVSGGQQAIDIISKALLDFGDTVITETPTYKGALNSFLGREARVISVDLQFDGLDINELKSKIEVRKPRFLYLMPFNQKPTGISYSIEKKLKILELANKYNFYIVEDDLGSELIHSKNNKTLKALDKFDRVIYIKSFTPLFMPGLRLGCIIPPEKIFKKFLEIKAHTDISTPGLIQRAFTSYLDAKDWINYYSNVQENLERKIEITNNILIRDFKKIIEYKYNKSSPIFWIKLNKGDSGELKNICIQNGLDITKGSKLGNEYSNYFLLNVKSIPFNNIEKGLVLLKKSIIFLYQE